MLGLINDEVSRMRLAFETLLSDLPTSSNSTARNDEEAPIIHEMPGGFPIPQENSQQPSSPVKSRLRTISVYLFSACLILIVIPLYILYRVLIFIFLLVISVYLKAQNRGYTSVSNKSNDPSNIARRFISNFDERIRGLGINDDGTDDINRPDFLECGYSHALYLFKRDIRWLMVYVEGDGENNETVKFSNDILINKKFLSFLHDRKILVWGGSISDSESFQLTNQFNITKLPFLGLLCLTVNQTPTSSGIQQSTPTLSLVSKIQGYKNLDLILKKFDKAFRKYNPTIELLRAKNKEQPLFRDLENEAMNQALVRNQSRIRNDEFNETGTTSRLRPGTATELADLRKKFLLWKKYTIQECEASDDITRIALRLPNQPRKVIKLNEDLSTEDVYLFITCNFIESDLSLEENTDYEQPEEDYEFIPNFKLVSMTNHETLPCDSTLKIRDNSEIYPTGNFIVEMINENL